MFPAFPGLVHKRPADGHADAVRGQARRILTRDSEATPNSFAVLHDLSYTLPRYMILVHGSKPNSVLLRLVIYLTTPDLRPQSHHGVDVVLAMHAAPA